MFIVTKLAAAIISTAVILAAAIPSAGAVDASSVLVEADGSAPRSALEDHAGSRVALKDRDPIIPGANGEPTPERAEVQTCCGSRVNFGIIDRAWGRVDASSIYFESGGESACCWNYNLKDKCPGDGKYVFIRIEFNVNNWPDEEWSSRGDTQGHTCSSNSYYFSESRDFNFVNNINSARIQLCKIRPDGEGRHCTAWGNSANNPES